MAVVEIERRSRIAYVRLNRPEAKNAIDKEVHTLLCQAWEALGADDAIDVVILTGTGDAFRLAKVAQGRWGRSQLTRNSKLSWWRRPTRLMSGRIKVEPKEKIKERLRRSPDRADALALAVGPLLPGGELRISWI